MGALSTLYDGRNSSRKARAAGAYGAGRSSNLEPPGAHGGSGARGAGMQERRAEMRRLQAGSTRRAKATEGPTVCSVTALRVVALARLATTNA